MSDNSKISWTDRTWNPLLGCTRVSAGCDGCYAINTATIRAGNPHPAVKAAFAGLTERRDGRLDWTGRVNLLPTRLDQPLHWRKPARVFVNSQSDLFHEQVPDEYVAQVFAIMSQAPQHTFQVLTKRHGRMRSLLNRPGFTELVQRAVDALCDDPDEQHIGEGWPLRNVCLGVSVENQHWANIRIPALFDTPNAVPWASAEPLLGPLRVRDEWLSAADGPGLAWVVAGGESGPRARPMHPTWVRDLRDQCVTNKIAFHFKQWGEWGPAPWRVEREPGEPVEAYKVRAEAACATHAYAVWADRYEHEPCRATHKPWSLERCGLPDSHAPIRRWGTKAAGRELDGKVWNEYPVVASCSA